MNLTPNQKRFRDLKRGDVVILHDTTTLTILDQPRKGTFLVPPSELWFVNTEENEDGLMGFPDDLVTLAE